MDETKRLWLWLNYATSTNPRLFFELLSRFDDLSEAREAILQRDFEAFSDVSETVKDRLIAAADDRFLDRYCAWLERNEVRIVTPECDEYPSLLSEIYDPPSVLFCKGTLPKELPLPIAMVGARNCTDYGREVAELLGEQLAERGATVVTGLAAGIDSACAKGALSAGSSSCPVIGVLGCGIDVVYPQNNGALYEKVLGNGGALVTEFLPKTPPLQQNFPIRNRILSGISRGVVVIEAGERSGTSITADCAREQGREVFAVPGRITDPMSVGVNRMITRGEAKPVMCAADILSEFCDDAGDDVLNGAAKKVTFTALGGIGQEIYMALLQGEKSADELLEWIDCSVQDLNAALTRMLFAEVIKQLPGRIYALDTIHTVVTFDQ
ncbi:MAG: DNA-processing protein DprA [Clostridia bacterium]|nr:DNA-processing protein DprA [Clostridia bacterium]